MDTLIKFLISIFKNMDDSTYQGAFDNRSEQEKSFDFKWSELSVLGELKLEERAPKVGYTQRFQNGSGSCVAQTVAKMLEIWDYRHDNTPTVYSATPVYQKRINKPKVGMVGVDALGIAVDGNIYLEEDVPSQKMDDSEMDDVTLDTLKKRKEHPMNYLVMPISFDAIAQETEHIGSTMVWFKCSSGEWNRAVPKGNSASEAVRHSVTAVDALSWKGVEYIIIEDSWGSWNEGTDIPLKPGQRAISREFFDAHCFFAATFTTFYFDGGGKPKYRWAKGMSYGMRSEDVKYLQIALKYEKFFPSNQECTGFFGGMTAKALKNWQISHGFLDFQYETDMRKIRAGAKTIALLNALYK